MRDQISVMHIVSGDLWAGAENMLLNLCMGLRECGGVRLYVVILNNGKLEEMLHEHNFDTIVINENEFSFIQILYKLKKSVKQIKPHVIHTHRKKENILGAIAGVMSGIPSIRTVHGSNEFNLSIFHIYKQSSDILDWFAGRFLQKKLVAVSDELKIKLTKMYGERRVTVVRNGINTQFIKKMAETPCALTSKSETVIKIGIVGRLVAVKRVDLFLKIAENLNQNYKEKLQFYIIGDGPLRTAIQALVSNAETHDNIHMVGHMNDVASCINVLDVLLLLSDHEGLPMVMLEAMTLAVPVIAHNVGAISKTLDNGKYGTLIDSQNTNEYVAEILQFMNNPQPYHAKALAACKYVMSDYSHTAMAQSYMSLYKDLTR